MDFIREGFWILVGLLVGVVASYVPLSKSIAKVREDAVMKKECKELSDLRAVPITQVIETLAAVVAEVKGDVKEMREEIAQISRYINGRTSQ